MNKRFYKAMPGRDQEMLNEFLTHNFIAVDFGVNTNMASMFTGDFREFNKKAIPIVQTFRPEKTKVSAGLAAGCIWRVGYGMQIGDIVLCPNAKSELHVGEVSGDYFYSEGNKFPHRRKVTWLPNQFAVLIAATYYRMASNQVYLFFAWMNMQMKFNI